MSNMVYKHWPLYILSFTFEFTYLYVLDDFGIKGAIIRVGRDFGCAIFEQIFLPIRKRRIRFAIVVLRCPNTNTTVI